MYDQFHLHTYRCITSKVIFLYEIDDSYRYIVNDCEKTNVCASKFSFYAARTPFALKVL